MVEAWLKLPEWVRVMVACLVCFALFTADLFSSRELNEAQLYPIAMLPLYRIRTRYLLWIICSLTAVMTLAGYLIEPSDDMWGGMTNRVISLFVIGLTVFGMGKLATYEERLLIESMTDPLTGLLNRRYFDEQTRKEVARSRRHGLRFSVLMIDIDHFKRINDSYGHPVGDLAIKALAEVCSNALRPQDILARYGGEEFVLTLPHTSVDGAGVVAERIRHGVEQVALDTEAGPVRFTVSIGISTYSRDLPFEQIVGRADEALYRAKQRGRNCVVALPFEDARVPA
jgi:diguanylate cyclase (GGDEF)-like protein